MGITPNYDLDVDTSLGGSSASDYVIPSQKAIKSYVDNNSGVIVDQTFDSTSANAQSGVAIAGELTKYVDLSTAQNISGRKTFLGEKAIYFKQNATTNKLGFTLYNPSNTELGAFEYRPSTIGNNALLNINTSYSNTCYPR